jgi:alkylated DNA repair dioxygenase AlkB
MVDADVTLIRDAFDGPECERFFNTLERETSWRQESANFYCGHKVPLPRLTTWYGDANAKYLYSGILNDPLPWTHALTRIKERIEDITITTFNSVLLNYYRDGRDSVCWHSDDEPELGANPVIASVSFGVTRQFQFRHKFGKGITAIPLVAGSVLIMRGTTQRYWLHQLPKAPKIALPRINLTFRLIRINPTL